MTRKIERFETRLDLIRQSLDIPGMSVAVVHKQAVVSARVSALWTSRKELRPRRLHLIRSHPLPRHSHRPWHYGWYADAFSSMLFKVPEMELTLILLACTDRASSVFRLGNGDPLHSPFVTAFLDAFGRDQ